MPADIAIAQTPHYLRITMEGPVNFATAKENIAALAAAAADTRADRVLLDIRNAESELATTDFWYLAQELVQRPHGLLSKIALLHATHHQHDAGFFALCATNRGFAVEPFTSEARAIAWLAPSGLGQ